MWRQWVGLLHCSISRAEDVDALRKRAPFQLVSVNSGVVATATATMRDAAVPLFTELLDGKAADAKTWRMLLDALARIPSDAAFASLASRLAVVAEYARALTAEDRAARVRGWTDAAITVDACRGGV